MLRMADKSVAFVSKTTDCATTTPVLVPSFVDLAELQQDTAGMAALTPLRQQFDQLAMDTDSTVMIAGSEAYGNALTVYATLNFWPKTTKLWPSAAAAQKAAKNAGAA